MLYLGSDHAGYSLKHEIAAHLQTKGIAFEDMGTHGPESVDYPDYGALVAKAVVAGPDNRGILICGTGIGISIAANKIAGIRAALCHTEFEAEMCRRHNDANILCLGSRVIGPGLALALIDRFLAASFEGGRHAGRVAKISALEQG
jgi:ribose 5-phosphate isomerase B